MNSKISLIINECITKKISIFNDRAEVTRQAEINVQEGVQEILIQKLSSFVEESSVRVSLSSDSKAMILEVSNYLQNDEEEVEESKKYLILKELKDKITAVEKRILILKDEKDNIKKQNDWLENYANKITSSNLKPIALEEANRFMDYYHNKSKIFEEKCFEIDDKIEELEEEKIKLEKPAKRIQSTMRNVSVLINATESAKITLKLIYLTSNASWIPS